MPWRVRYWSAVLLDPGGRQEHRGREPDERDPGEGEQR